jgi:hypothetical protein
VKILFALLLCAAGVCQAQVREGYFEIRFEPKAVLQTNAPIPFEITVKDDLGKPLIQAKVTLEIQMEGHVHTKVYQAPSTGPGVYVAKPVFPEAGEWQVYVEVRRNNQMSARTIQFNVPEEPSR